MFAWIIGIVAGSADWIALWRVKWISRGMYPLERKSSSAMSSPAFRMPRDFSPPPGDAHSRTFRAGRIVKPDIRTTGMNSNGISPPVGWFARRNVIFITSVAAKFPRKFQILYILHVRATEYIAKIWSKSQNDRRLWKWREHTRQEYHAVRMMYPNKYYLSLFLINIA